MARRGHTQNAVGSASVQTCRVLNLGYGLLQGNGQHSAFYVNLPISQRVCPPCHRGEMGTQRGDLLKAKGPQQTWSPGQLNYRKGPSVQQPTSGHHQTTWSECHRWLKADQDRVIYVPAMPSGNNLALGKILT